MCASAWLCVFGVDRGSDRWLEFQRRVGAVDVEHIRKRRPERLARFGEPDRRARGRGRGPRWRGRAAAAGPGRRPSARAGGRSTGRGVLPAGAVSVTRARAGRSARRGRCAGRSWLVSAARCACSRRSARRCRRPAPSSASRTAPAACRAERLLALLALLGPDLGGVLSRFDALAVATRPVEVDEERVRAAAVVGRARNADRVVVGPRCRRPASQRSCAAGI